MKCPRCRLINPDEAERCDCGYDFGSGTIERSYIPPERTQANERANRDMLQGALWCFGGIAITVWTYELSGARGGVFIVAWGAILFGAVQFFRGALARR